ncbi:hypothetical protein C6P40_001896 [Pichia californica]|uniref:Uncharacterized protein n=1 Tax=Pichia californica TaxID=460514 RepID=A0A9P6WQW4_9ASCO|nr:hypothetical protein C6P42_003210 [[Candida] californica]KAG0690673.1 hypothetical protein C6P40_001896 [[Candida] californica]
MSQIETQRNKAILQKARISRAYLDAAKSFGIEQDLEFCPCLDMSLLESSPAISTAASLKMNQQQHNYVDSESIFKILAAAANAKNYNNNITNNNNNNNNNIGYNSQMKQMINNVNNNANNNGTNNGYNFMNINGNIKQINNMKNGASNRNKYYN